MTRSRAHLRMVTALVLSSCSAGGGPEPDAGPEPAPAVARTDEHPGHEPLLTDLELGVEYPVVVEAELYMHPLGRLGQIVTEAGDSVWLSTSSHELVRYHGRRVRITGKLWTCGDDRRLSPVEVELLPGEPETGTMPPPPRVRSYDALDELRSPWVQVVGELGLHGDRVGLFSLDGGGGALIVQLDERSALRPGVRTSLTIRREGPPHVIVTSCAGEHARCEEPEFDRVALGDARMCARARALGLQLGDTHELR